RIPAALTVAQRPQLRHPQPADPPGFPPVAPSLGPCAGGSGLEHRGQDRLDNDSLRRRVAGRQLLAQSIHVGGGYHGPPPPPSPAPACPCPRPVVSAGPPSRRRPPQPGAGHAPPLPSRRRPTRPLHHRVPVGGLREYRNDRGRGALRVVTGPRPCSSSL